MTETSKALWSKPWGFLLQYLSARKGKRGEAASDVKPQRPSDIVDIIQSRLEPFWAENGFKGRGRNYNRRTADGLTQFINFQISQWGLSDDGYGRFTINAGVFIPEVWEAIENKKAPSHISLVHCTKYERIGLLVPDRKDIWWAAKNDPKIIKDIEGRLRDHVLPFITRFETRARCLDSTTTYELSSQITRAILLNSSGRFEEARKLLEREAADAESRKASEYANRIRQIIARLGL